MGTKTVQEGAPDPVTVEERTLDADPAKLKAVNLTVGQIEKQFGEGAIMRLGDEAARQRIPAIPTGALGLDVALGIGGVPRGRVVEIFGPESSGKSTLALSIMANAQRLGGLGAYIDAEHAVDPSYAKKIGVNLDDLLISQPDCGEDALNIAEMLVRSNAIDVIVVDSVAALVPRAEIEGEIGDQHVGLQARLMSQALRKLTSAVARSRTCVIFINQMRMKIGVMFGNPETTPGGKALKFYSSVRIDLRRTETIKSSTGDPIGNRVKARIVKNKVAPPFRLAEFDIMYDEGISAAGNILDLAVQYNIVEKRGAWFNYGEERLGQGREAVRTEIKNNAKLAAELAAKVKEKLLIP
ncbi:MAG: recombinase RecA [Verrucomicrobia bacterium]|nr:recombinase RecA [Verrucomicrobiota bacterium]